MEATQAKEAVNRATPEAVASSCEVRGRFARLTPWLILGGSLAAAAGVYTGWDWLAASGAAGVLLTLAPCLAMCALGLCMGRDRKP